MHGFAAYMGMKPSAAWTELAATERSDAATKIDGLEVEKFIVVHVCRPCCREDSLMLSSCIEFLFICSSETVTCTARRVKSLFLFYSFYFPVAITPVPPMNYFCQQEKLECTIKQLFIRTGHFGLRVIGVARRRPRLRLARLEARLQSHWHWWHK